MSDEPKKPLTETAVRDVKEELATAKNTIDRLEREIADLKGERP